MRPTSASLCGSDALQARGRALGIPIRRDCEDIATTAHSSLAGQQPRSIGVHDRLSSVAGQPSIATTQATVEHSFRRDETWVRRPSAIGLMDLGFRVSVSHATASPPPITIGIARVRAAGARDQSLKAFYEWIATCRRCTARAQMGRRAALSHVVIAPDSETGSTTPDSRVITADSFQRAPILCVDATFDGDAQRRLLDPEVRPQPRNGRATPRRV